MQVKIEMVAEGYLATVTPSHGDDIAWAADHPMTQRELINRLATLGFHEQDIGDAFFEADPGWETKSETS